MKTEGGEDYLVTYWKQKHSSFCTSSVNFVDVSCQMSPDFLRGPVFVVQISQAG